MLPQTKKIAKEFAGQPPHNLNVNWYETKCKDFVEKQEMAGCSIATPTTGINSFRIHATPHSFTIHADGVLTAEMLGSDADIEGMAKKLMAKALHQLPSHFPQQEQASSTFMAPLSPCQSTPTRLASNVEAGLQSRCATNAG